MGLVAEWEELSAVVVGVWLVVDWVEPGSNEQAQPGKSPAWQDLLSQ